MVNAPSPEERQVPEKTYGSRGGCSWPLETAREVFLEIVRRSKMELPSTHRSKRGPVPRVSMCEDGVDFIARLAAISQAFLKPPCISADTSSWLGFAG